MSNTNLLARITQLRAIADTGLLYAKNEYDIERYQELRHLSTQMFDEVSGYGEEKINLLFPQATDYPTAKVDLRGILLSPDHKILLARESGDGKWSLPGGWGDIGYSPKETIIKEFFEETGLQVSAERLLAVFDKKMHPHPPQPFYVYKMVFYCKAITTQVNKGFDVLDVQYFDINNLPPLSEDRILKSQIELVYQKIINNDISVWAD
ncbi:ADP-ribose pyrophosphatase YjhB (NUDIX family) [Mucilaginibacter oryzae]|uniref:ADP-ribose pyrophosphatase YjhB (NUDIX family) n=1 Tax=Mucilaginibacter oryzae TaxID=468058 RepID=A0A316H553_9SPHI|nr:NUDIX hydrolase [Mucilaginibacter oryzae]PWK74183.1 ADP-ribose pyrophosphatase YjhB (NUDIX family) [Mucilaginibacter oryzae]